MAGGTRSRSDDRDRNPPRTTRVRGGRKARQEETEEAWRRWYQNDGRGNCAPPGRGAARSVRSFPDGAPCPVRRRNRTERWIEMRQRDWIYGRTASSEDSQQTAMSTCSGLPSRTPSCLTALPESTISGQVTLSSRSRYWSWCPPNGLPFTCGAAARAGVPMILRCLCGGTDRCNGLLDSGKRGVGPIRAVFGVSPPSPDGQATPVRGRTKA